MRANPKLTKIVAGRTISPPTTTTEGKLRFTLDDGSVMDVTTATGFTYPPGKGGKIAKVQQQGTDLIFVLEGGGSVDIKLAEETSSVLMHNKAGDFVYSD